MSSIMEELHEAAVAYYNNGSVEQQNLAWQFFQALDVDGNGRVSLQEYTNFLYKTAGLACVHPEMFRALDRNGDGQLDFWEVLTLYYVARTRTIRCRTCLHALTGLYFTCVTCFESPCGDDTFDLCVNCYRQQSYSHPHRVFLDSYVLFRSKRSHHLLEGVSVVKILLHVTRPNTLEFGNIPETQVYQSVKRYREDSRIPGFLILAVESPIYFANSTYLQERWTREEETRIKENNGSNLKCIILEMTSVSSIDTSGIEAVFELRRRLEKQSLQLVMVNPVGSVMEKLHRSKSIESLGLSGLYLTVGEAVAGLSCP